MKDLQRNRTAEDEKEKHLEVLKKLDWMALPEDTDFDLWEDDHALSSTYSLWPDEDPAAELGQIDEYTLYDPNEILPRIVSAMQYSIEQMKQKQYSDVLEINSRLNRLDLWAAGPVQDIFDGPVILEFLADHFPDLDLPMDLFGKLGFTAVYNTASPDERPAKLYEYLHEYGNTHWHPFSLSELLKEYQSELEDWKTVFPALYEYAKEKDQWSMSVLGKWGDDFYRIINGEDAFIRLILLHHAEDLHLTKAGEKKVLEVLHPDVEESWELDQWCRDQIFLDESQYTWNKSETKILARTPVGVFTIHPKTFTIALKSASR